MLGQVRESDAQFVDRMISGLVPDVSDDRAYEALNPVERDAALVWVAVGRIAVDGWAGWIASFGHRSGDLVEALRAMGAGGLAEDAQQLGDMQLDNDSAAGRLAELERRWFALVRTTSLVENHLAPWIRSHPADMPSTVDDL